LPLEADFRPRKIAEFPVPASKQGFRGGERFGIACLHHHAFGASAANQGRKKERVIPEG
jgi:hypothetical protein